MAAGVFLGMAAWTNREEIGNVALYGVIILITLLVIVYIYSAVSTPIKDSIVERQVGLLIVELNKHGLLEDKFVGAALEGLKRFYYESTRNELAELLDSIKKKRSNQESCSVEENRVSELLVEIIDDFKQAFRKD
jgi:type III secretory pathway component EscR